MILNENFKIMYDSLPNNCRQEIEKFLKNLEAYNYSIKTIKGYKYRLAKFFSYTNKNTIEKISESDLEDYLIFVGKTKRKAKYKKYIASILNTYLKFFKKKDILIERRKIQGDDSLEVEWFTKNQIEKIIAESVNVGVGFNHGTAQYPVYFGARKLKILIMLSYDCGLRISEVIELQRKDIDLRNNRVLITEGKGGKKAFVYFSEKTKNMLLDYLNSNEFLPDFPKLFYYIRAMGEEKGKAKKLDEWTLRKLFYIILDRTKIQEKDSVGNFHFHSLRHSVGSHMIADGYTVEEVRKHLRHTKGSPATLIYLHSARKDTEKKKMPIENMKIR